MLNSYEIIIFILMCLKIVCIIAYYMIIKKENKIEKKIGRLKKNFDLLNEYNKEMDITDDEMKVFRHDFNNIMQAIGGYIKFEDFDGLKEYYKDLKAECKLLNEYNKN